MDHEICKNNEGEKTLNILHKSFFFLGVYLKNPKVFKQYNFLKETECWDRNQIEKYQISQVNDLIEHAIKNSPYYLKKYNNLDVKVETLNDLKKIPILNKRDLLNFNEEIQINLDEKLIFSETSGSTGEPLVFYRDTNWDGAHRAAQLRGYSWHGVFPWNKNGYFWGYDFSGKSIIKIKTLDFLLNRFRVFSYKDKDINNFTKKLEKAQYVEGYSSMIYEVAKVMNKKKRKNYSLKMIKGTSEKIYDHYQDEIQKAFGRKMISEYGAAEAGIIAFECAHNNMHITEENVILEEENGEIIITNLVSKSFPIIRYNLGDSIVLNKVKKCPCGLEHHIIEEITGRIGKSVVGKKNQYPSLTFYYIFKNLAINHNLKYNYQVVQKTKGTLVLFLEQNLSSTELEKIQKGFYEYFSNDIELIISKEKLVRDYDSKFKDFISYL